MPDLNDLISLLDRALTAADPESALTALAEAVARPGGYRVAFEALLTRAAPVPGGIEKAEGLLVAMAQRTGDASMRSDLLRLFQANQRWACVDALGAPVPPEALKTVALAHLTRGDLARGRQRLVAHLENAPGDVDALMRLGLAERALYHPEAAEACFRRAMALAPDAPHPRAELALSLWHRRADAEALPLFEEALRGFPGDLRLGSLVASTRLALGRTDGLVPFFRAILAAGAPWDARLLEPAAQMQAEPPLAEAFFTAVAEHLGEPWAAAFRRRAATGQPQDAPGPDAPWAALLALPPRRTFGVAVIARGASPNLGRALDSLATVADELVVLDAQADPAAIAAARARPGVRVAPINWEDDLSAARNAGMAHLHTDWMGWMPSDDYTLNDARAMTRLLQRPTTERDGVCVFVGPLVRLLEGEEVGRNTILFIVPLDRALRYEGALQERLVDTTVPRRPFRYVPFPEARVYQHMTRESLARQAVLKRPIVERMLAAAPEAPTSLYAQAQLLQDEGDRAGAAAALERALEGFGATTNMFALAAAVMLANLRLELRELPAALAVCQRALATFPDDPDLHAIAGLALLLTGRPAEARPHFAFARTREGLPASAATSGAYAGWLAELGLAVATWRLGEPGAAAHLQRAWRMAPTPAVAAERLRAYAQLMGLDPAPLLLEAGL
jgi:tetratricopeptide (TPR) repeat protein